MLRILLSSLAAFLFSTASVTAEITIPVIYLQQLQDRPPVLSGLDPVPDDLGLAGARLGLTDNQTTGQFLGHDYSLEVVQVPVDGDWAAATRDALSRSKLILLDAPPRQLLHVADRAEAADAVLLNVAARDNSLRDADCRANLLHSIPSEAMRADALIQFAKFRRWNSLALIAGAHPQDIAFANALKASAQKFGLAISAEKTWTFDADMRRNAAQEVPLFTQPMGDYDLLLVADELHDFGRYIAFNTWLPRPVAGSEGLQPVAWSPVVEQWGAAQLQNRFLEAAQRDMRAEDYAAWAAMRTLGEAVTRTGSADPTTLRGFVLSEAFELAGFKGRALSFRSWNGQLRQPIPLVTDRALVAQAPLPGYLHQRTELDTLGLDRPESNCEAFK